MFSRKSEKLDGLIGPGSDFRGELRSQGTVRIDGTCTGTVFADLVIVGEGGTVRGDLIARSVVVAGLVEGNIDAQELVDLLPKGRVKGDIQATRLAIADGGVFEGRSLSKKSDEKVIGFPGQELSRQG